ncbi:hypothetical protein [Phycicoccus flavus]|uniref:hypothetical protein n=1 Tax=Phycicoccus flavus TaxID=2502783 RepID=UPI000FEC1B4E|nr:hypothetical protein [Phycicoccus flavus]NHA67962.1 hypothetical protein [Phycicoccus flavus]
MSIEDEELARHDSEDVVLQQVIDELVRTDRAWTVDAAATELRDGIEAAGLPPRAPSWVTAVAEGVVRGEAYVVTTATRRETDVPQPPKHLENRVID